jgi:hypothetical protein
MDFLTNTSSNTGSSSSFSSSFVQEINNDCEKISSSQTIICNNDDDNRTIVIDDKSVVTDSEPVITNNNDVQFLNLEKLQDPKHFENTNSVEIIKSHVVQKKDISHTTLLETLVEIEKILAAVSSSSIGFSGLTRNDMYNRQNIDSCFTNENVFEIYLYAKKNAISELLTRSSIYIATNLESEKLDLKQVSYKDLEHFYTLMIEIKTETYGENSPLIILLKHVNKMWAEKASSIIESCESTKNKKDEIPASNSIWNFIYNASSQLSSTSPNQTQ